MILDNMSERLKIKFIFLIHWSNIDIVEIDKIYFIKVNNLLLFLLIFLSFLFVTFPTDCNKIWIFKSTNFQDY